MLRFPSISRSIRKRRPNIHRTVHTNRTLINSLTFTPTAQKHGRWPSTRGKKHIQRYETNIIPRNSSFSEENGKSGKTSFRALAWTVDHEDRRILGCSLLTGIFQPTQPQERRNVPTLQTKSITQCKWSSVPGRNKNENLRLMSFSSFCSTPSGFSSHLLSGSQIPVPSSGARECERGFWPQLTSSSACVHHHHLRWLVVVAGCDDW